MGNPQDQRRPGSEDGTLTMAFQLWQKRDTKGWATVGSKVGWKIWSGFQSLFWIHSMRLFLRHIESTGTWLVWIEAACCYVAVTFGSISDWYKTNMVSEGTLFPVKPLASGTYTPTGPQHLVIWMNPIMTSFQSNPMAVIILMVNILPLPFSNAMFPGYISWFAFAFAKTIVNNIMICLLIHIFVFIVSFTYLCRHTSLKKLPTQQTPLAQLS